MNRHRQLGISLIEILVATAIAGVILTGVVQLFTSMKQSEQLSMSLARLQENGRFAVDILSRELRMAGYQGCSNPNQDFVPPANILIADFPLENVSQQVIVGATMPANGDSVSLYSGANAITISDAEAGTDLISVVYASPVSASLDADMADSSAAISMENNSANFAVGDALIISNCTAEGQFVFRASGVTTSPATIEHEATHNKQANFGSLAFKEKDTVRRVVLNIYYIRKNLRGIPSLYRRSLDGGASEEIIEGVDNLKLLYAHYDDNHTAGSHDDTVVWLDAVTINASPSYEWSNVTGIKVALLMSGEQEVLAEAGPDKYDMLGTDVSAPSDKRLRRVFSTSVKVRNRDGKRISM